MNDESPWLHDGTYRARWLREVLRSPSITDSVRVLLLTFGLHMDASGRVSVPRDVLVGLLGRSERKVGDKVRAALDSGFLVQIARGQKYQTAVYQAAIGGEALSVTPGGPAEPGLRMTPGVPPEPNLSRTPGGPPEDSQGDGFKHPENSSDDSLSRTPGGPPERSQQDPRGSSHIYGGVYVGDQHDADTGSLFEVDAASRPPTHVGGTRTRRRRPETPIPADFALTEEMRAYAARHGITVDLDRETRRFINHALSRDRRCRDWTAAWRNWIDKAQEFADRDAQRAAPAKPTSGPMATYTHYREEDIWT